MNGSGPRRHDAVGNTELDSEQAQRVVAWLDDQIESTTAEVEISEARHRAALIRGHLPQSKRQAGRTRQLREDLRELHRQVAALRDRFPGIASDGSAA